ncbi:ribonuclease HII [Cytobacillus massiliigabonensis]|uniref:ribonuclease HII n=1 Tax=Cytobacillus massiliigabonensis TaxID=1871011 RepID=UPI000C86255A|nr:ribonuclease HII [Cytobacillus massiliigabonensis]
MGKISIREIEEKLIAKNGLDDSFIELLANDERKGVQQLLKKWHRQMEEEKKSHEKHVLMTKYEKKYRNLGHQHIAGVDEVGRGPLAGPVVTAAVILPADFYLPGLDDSKKLSEQKREEYFEIIQSRATAISVGMIDVDEIDRINIYEATKKAMTAAIVHLNVQPDFLLIDAVKLNTPYPSEAIIKGDAKSISIAAASIIAKVTRDRLMINIGKEYPEYGFGKHMGYGTKEHLAAIRKFGITPYHRKSFSPIKEYVGK